MLEFKKFKLSDIEKIKKYTTLHNTYSCETNFVNLFIWQDIYKNRYAEKDGMLFVKSGEGEDECFCLPFGKDIKKGIEQILEYCGNKTPLFWVQQGDRFREIETSLLENYQLTEQRDSFDYIYSQSDLANLSGKKYHSKRNHISAFSKQYNWEYREITEDIIPDILECAEKWYKGNADRFDKYMQCEKDGIKTILENMDRLSAKGGAIYVDGKPVAFTLGSPLNGDIFDVHIEKALPEYATAYTVINNEFAKRLGEYKYINREDDMGLSGLRKAKLSYKPEILLKKYVCIPKKEICKNLYNSNFAEEDSTFCDELFGKYFKYCKYLEKDGKIVSFCFAFDCKIGEKTAKYIFAVATDSEQRNKGYATELLNKIRNESDAVLILRPANRNLISFYEKLGFKTFNATNEQSNFAVIPCDDLLNLAKDYKENSGNYTLMYLSDNTENLENIYFPYSMP